MITCQLIGGLGNQLFQIAATIALAIEYRDEAVFDLAAHYQLSQGSRAIDYHKTIYRKLTNLLLPSSDLIFQQQEFGYRSIPYQPGIKLVGLFHSDRYFSHYRSTILDLFAPKSSVIADLNSRYASVLSQPNCAIHVRRGDYLKRQHLNPVLSVEYYHRAIEMFDRDTTFLVFSDDIDWCRQTFTASHRFEFSEHNSDETDLYLMSMCQHQIIANSTFSWWASWLNQNPQQRIIAPKTWFGSALSHLQTADIYTAKMCQI